MKYSVMFLSGREIDYMRNRVVLTALRSHFDVTVLTPVGRSIVGRTTLGLCRFTAHRPSYDVCFAGFYGHPIAITLSLLQRKPIVFDAYVSTYDTLCEDRRLLRPHSPAGRLAYWLDQQSCRAATQVITDTRTHADHLAERFAVPRDKITTIYVGCDEELFFPRDELDDPQGRVNVFYYSAFLPLHGTGVIVRAAHLLRDRPEIHFTLGGDGPRRGTVERLVNDLGLTNVDLTGWIPTSRLPDYIARASICLGGHFSTVPKATRVISTKTFQFTAMRKPTIMGDNPATREVFIPGEHVCAVPMGNADALAEAIRDLAEDAALRHRIARGGYQIFRERLTTSAIADQLASVLEEAMCGSAF